MSDIQHVFSIYISVLILGASQLGAPVKCTSRLEGNICHGKVPKRMLDFVEDLRLDVVSH